MIGETSRGGQADNAEGGLELRRSLPSQVRILPNLALGARGGLAQACIGLGEPGRPIGPWSLRTGAPNESATRRDWNPDAHEIAHGTGRDTPG